MFQILQGKELRTPSDFVRAFRMEKDPEKALLIVKKAREIYGEDFMAREMYEALVKLGKYKEAIEEMNKFGIYTEILFKLNILYRSIGETIFPNIYDANIHDSKLKRAVFTFLLENGRLEGALKFASTLEDTLEVCEALIQEGEAWKVVSLLEGKKDRRSRYLYGRALYMLGRYAEAGRILEGIDDTLSARAYMKAGMYEKVMKRGNYKQKVEILFIKGKYEEALKICRNVLEMWQCFASSVIVEGTERTLEKLYGSKLENVHAYIPLFVEIIHKYPEGSENFFKALSGKDIPSDEQVLLLARAIHLESIGKYEEALKYYAKLEDWLEPFALYRMFIITGDRKFARKLLENYPSSAYAYMVGR